VRVLADDGRVDVPEAVDLGRAQEADVDQAALQVVGEELPHAGDRRRAGDDRGVADRERESRRARAEHACLVDELHVGGDRALGEVHGDVREADADEADALPGELAGSCHDHHLGLRELGRARGRGRGTVSGALGSHQRYSP
jgi:hypothetical protein